MVRVTRSTFSLLQQVFQRETLTRLTYHALIGYDNRAPDVGQWCSSGEQSRRTMPAGRVIFVSDAEWILCLSSGITHRRTWGPHLFANESGAFCVLSFGWDTWPVPPKFKRSKYGPPRDPFDATSIHYSSSSSKERSPSFFFSSLPPNLGFPLLRPCLSSLRSRRCSWCPPADAWGLRFLAFGWGIPTLPSDRWVFGPLVTLIVAKSKNRVGDVLADTQSPWRFSCE